MQIAYVYEDVRGHGLHQLDVRGGAAAAFPDHRVCVQAGRALQTLLSHRLG